MTRFPLAPATLLALLPLAASACIDRTVTAVEPVPSVEERTEFPVVQNRDIDILFVIDNSRSMLAEQDSLATNFVRIANALESVEGGLPNVHIGVVSTDLGAGGYLCGAGDGGRLQSTPRVTGCDAPDGAFISNIEGVPNYSGTLSDAFSCIARLGRNGCGFEQPLEAMRKALDGSNAENLGFLRESARLAVIFISDEDDCSVVDPGMFARVGEPGEDLGAQKSFRCFEHGVTCDNDLDPRLTGPRNQCQSRTDSDYMADVSEYVTFLKGLKQYEGQILVAGIIGDLAPIEVRPDAQGDPCLMYSCGDATVCAGAGDDEVAAVPPVRLETFIDAFSNSRVTTICSDDLSDAVQDIADAIPGFFSTCFANPLKDIDPGTPGLQADCSVSEVRHPNTSSQSETVVPACDGAGGALPCYRLVESLDDCPDSEQHISVEIDYPENQTLDPDTVIQAHCVGA